MKTINKSVILLFSGTVLIILIIFSVLSLIGISQKEVICEIENCHGLTIECGKNKAEACTLMYQIGDRCRNFASCQIVNQTCKHVKTPQFMRCEACVLECISKFSSQPDLLYQCESQC